MCQLTVQPILQITHEDPVQHGHFLKIITHTHMNDHKGGEFGEFSGLPLRCIQPVSVSVGDVSISSQEGQGMRT